MISSLPIEEILSRPPAPPEAGEEIGRSREGRSVRAFRFGHGPLTVSLIAGCHADEPVGPEMLGRLASYLGELAAADPLLAAASFYLVPHVNPDGAARNATWSGRTVAARDHLGREDRAYDLAAYLEHAVREAPGDDVEFGFPRDSGDTGARPENRAVADFLRPAAPFLLHASLHSITFAVGPWFLLDRAWIDRTGTLRENLRARVRRMGYRLHDVDRKGEKGFSRIDEGFSTRPDSVAMVEHFLAAGDPATARLFRPSSMEYVRTLGGDPLTVVSEMPMFLVGEPEEGFESPPSATGTAGRLAFARWLSGLGGDGGPEELSRRAARHGVSAMPLADQMRLQLAFLDEALAEVAAP